MSPERATRLSEGRSPSNECVNRKPCKGVRMMRVALSGLKKLSIVNVGLRPTLRRDALSGREKPVKSRSYPIVNAARSQLNWDIFKCVRSAVTIASALQTQLKWMKSKQLLRGSAI